MKCRKTYERNPGAAYSQDQLIKGRGCLNHSEFRGADVGPFWAGYWLPRVDVQHVGRLARCYETEGAASQQINSQALSKRVGFGQAFCHSSLRGKTNPVLLYRFGHFEILNASTLKKKSCNTKVHSRQL